MAGDFHNQLDKEARQWAMFCHLGGLAGMLIPLGNVIVPLIIWLWRRDDYSFVDTQGKEALNFQIWMSILGLICWVLTFVLIGFLLLLALAIVNVVMVIIAAINVNQGVEYRYPYTLRLLK